MSDLGALVTLGSLVADDLGLTLTVKDGGSSHTGTLRGVQHSIDYRDQPTTMVTLVSGEWRHIKTYPATTAAHLQPSEAPDPHDDAAGRGEGRGA